MIHADQGPAVLLSARVSASVRLSAGLLLLLQKARGEVHGFGWFFLVGRMSPYRIC